MKSFSRFTVLVGLLAVFLFSAMRLEAADPVVVELHFQNGVKYYKRGLYDRAVEEFEKTLNMEPEHEEAKIYLEKVRLIQKNQTKVEAKASKNAELKQLYEDGRRFFAAHKYQETIDVCNKILQIKPIDDFASYYREESEIMISRQLKREKKAQDKEKAKESRKQAKIDKAQEIEQLKESRKQAKIDRAEEKEKLKEARIQAKVDRENEKKEKAAERKAAREAARRPVDKTNREAVVQQDLAAYEVESTPRAKPEGEMEKPVDRKMRLRQEKLAEKERRREEKLQAREDKKQEKEERIAAKKAAAEERRAAKKTAIEERRAAKQAAVEERRQAKIDAKVRKALEKDEKAAARKETPEERREAKQAKIDAAQEKRAKKAEDAAQRRQNATDRKQDARVEKALKKETAKQMVQARKDNKELFLKGVDLYGKKKYEDAIAAFESLMAAESQTTGAVYSGTARRLIDKARERLKGEGKDKEIERRSEEQAGN